MNHTEPANLAQPIKMTSAGVRGAILWGLMGSVLVTAGSWGVGWLPNISDFNRIQPFIFLRTTIVGVLTSTIILTVGVWFMLYAWMRLGRALRSLSGQDPDRGIVRDPAYEVVGTRTRKPWIQDAKTIPAELYQKLGSWLAEQWSILRTSLWRSGSLKVTNIAIGIWSFPLLFAVPIFSRDMYAYVGQGRLVVNGGDPYEQGISSISNWFQLGTDSMWAEDGTPYGPVFIWLEEMVVRITGDSVEWAIFLLRLIAVIGVVLTIIYTPKLAQLHGIDPARAQWLASANTLYIISFVASGHNDVLMVGLALAAFYYALKRKGILAVVLLTLSVGIKPITIVLLPFLGLLWAGKDARWPRRLLYWCYSGAIFLFIMTAIGYLNGFGFGWVKVMLGTGTGYTFWSPVGFAQLLLSNLGNSFGFDPANFEAIVKLLGRLSSVVLVLILIFVGKFRNLSIRMTLAFTALVILSPVIHPWYLLWLLPFFAVIGIRDGWQLSWCVFTFAFLIGFGAFDQLHVWDFLGLGILPKVLSVAVSVVMILWLFVFDPKTKGLLDLTRIGRGIWGSLRRNTQRTV